MDMISEQVQNAINRNLDQPDFFPERQALSASNSQDILGQMTSLLQEYAPGFTEPVNAA